MKTKYEKHLTFDRSHLQPYALNLGISDIGLTHMKCPMEDIHAAETVVFRDTDGSRKVMKDRHGILAARKPFADDCARELLEEARDALKLRELRPELVEQIDEFLANID